MFRQWSGLPVLLLWSSAWSSTLLVVFVVVVNCLFVPTVGAMPTDTEMMSERSQAPSLLGDMMTMDSEAEEELEAIKQRILADLGLTRIPDVRKANVSAEEMSRMLEVYRRSIKESEEEERLEEEEEENSVYRFYSYKDMAPQELSQRHPRSIPTVLSQILFFPLDITSYHSNKTAGLSLQSAKLRVPWPTQPLRITSSYYPSSGDLARPQPIAAVRIYQLLDNPSSANATRVLVDTQTVRQDSSHLAEVDVSDSVRAWIEDPAVNFGLYVECHGCQPSFLSEIQNRTSDRNATISSSSIDDQKRAVLDILVSESAPRIKRSNPTPEELINGTKLDCTKGFESKMCCRRSMKVNLKDVGWHWIVRPEEFEAAYCKGKCRYKAHNFASAHALIQSVMKRKGSKIPSPCCTPKKLKSLNMLHYNDKDPPELVITRQKGMIVRECSCS